MSWLLWGPVGAVLALAVLAVLAALWWRVLPALRELGCEAERSRQSLEPKLAEFERERGRMNRMVR